MIKPGIYEQVINNKIKNELDKIPDERKSISDIDEAESAKILSQYIADIVEKGLNNVLDNGGSVSTQVELANKIVETIENETGETDFNTFAVDDKAEQLFAILKENDPKLALGKNAYSAIRPETSIAKSSLFTNAIYEPMLATELKKEIASSDEISMIVSFIKWSGLRQIINELREFTQNGGKLRVITTSYMGATELKSVEELRKLPNTEVKVCYDTKNERLHTKAYVFYRENGFTTAYVGSSNLSNAAISSGREWNVKITRKDLPEVIQKITATFESYWNTPEFEYYDENERERLSRALKAERFIGDGENRKFVFDIRPYPFQREILDKLQAERKVRGYNKNLVVAATGTGKTVISAFDYKRFQNENVGEANRLLFVAHREEILKQSLETFQGVLRNPNFGELFVGSYKPESLDYLFTSIQTVNSQALWEKLSENYYDFIIIDEFHHAAAPTYHKLLSHFKPKILLGLTATPERMDGKNILDYFGGRVAAEIRLPEAIERQLLCPFQYFGITDVIDLKDIRWTRGGYEKSELENVYVLNREIAEKRAMYIITSLEKYVSDVNKVKGLGFCVSVQHAKFMAECFNKAGIPSICIVGESNEEERNSAKKKLASGELRFIFAVDIYNEGVDIPEVNTVLFLRPTESLTVFLQQLGRGLRLSDGKDCLTVLDFIGQSNKKYNFEEKFAALLSHTTHSVQHELEKGFPSVPMGCYIQLEKKASQYILDNIKSSFNTKQGIISRISTFCEDSGLELNLENFLSYYHLDLGNIYGKFSFYRLQVIAGVREDFSEPAEEILTGAFKKIISINSRRWIKFLLKFLQEIGKLDILKLSPEELRMLQMFYITIWGTSAKNWNGDEVKERLAMLEASPTMRSELVDILKYEYDTIDFIDEPVNLGFECPLDVYCSYTRDQLLVAMDYMTPENIREGVKWLPDKKIDVLMVTLNKADKDYSPTTMYNDYSVNENLFHWQSQSTTADTSITGQRYINHRSNESKILLFVREFKTEMGITSPYTFLGTVQYVSHTGSKPMNILWKLDKPIPAKYLKKTNKLNMG
jgi:superfamily II DNA or RNA helicase